MSFCDEWLEKAIDAADKATILERKYAKFYCTKGRLIAVAGRYDDGVSLVRVAIDLEDSALTDYAIRIGDYQYFLLRILAAKNEHVMRENMGGQLLALQGQVTRAESQVEDSVRRADDASIRNLEFLGFFAALISFTIGSIQISVPHKAADVATLIVVLFGSLLCAFAGFSFIVQRDLRYAARRAVPVFMLGVFVLMIGLLV